MGRELLLGSGGGAPSRRSQWGSEGEAPSRRKLGDLGGEPPAFGDFYDFSTNVSHF